MTVKRLAKPGTQTTVQEHTNTDTAASTDTGIDSTVRRAVAGRGPGSAFPAGGVAVPGRAVIRRTLHEQLDKQKTRTGLFKDDRVSGHDTAQAKRLLTAKLLIRKETQASRDGEQLNVHEEGLLGRVTESADMLTGNLASAQLAICHKVASSDAQDQVVAAYAANKLASLQNRVDRIKFVDWADISKLSDDGKKRYAEYQKAVENYYAAAQKSLNDILTYKTREQVPIDKFNEFLDKVVNTPLNYFVGSQKINGPVSDNRDANMGNIKTRGRSMTLESIQLHKGDTAGNKFIDQEAATDFGEKSRVHEWSETASSGELLVSSLPVPTAFSAPSKRAPRKKPGEAAPLKGGVKKRTQATREKKAKKKKTQKRTKAAIKKVPVFVASYSVVVEPAEPLARRLLLPGTVGAHRRLAGALRAAVARRCVLASIEKREMTRLVPACLDAGPLLRAPAQSPLPHARERSATAWAKTRLRAAQPTDDRTFVVSSLCPIATRQFSLCPPAPSRLTRSPDIGSRANPSLPRPS